MRKLSARWVPLHQIRVRMNISNALLAQFSRNKSEFWRQLITVDETWIHLYMSESKIPSEKWTTKRQLAPKKAKTVYFGWESGGH